MADPELAVFEATVWRSVGPATPEDESADAVVAPVLKVPRAETLPLVALALPLTAVALPD